MRATTLLLALLFSTPALGQTTFTVTTTADAGAGSLRQAILDANANPGADVIAFAIPGAGPHTIQPQTALPALTGPATVDGLTQPGASCAAWPATLRIELDGSALTATPFGLTLSGGDSTVRGLVINGFDGVSNASAGILITSDDNVVACNFVGTDVAGTAGSSTQENETGILIDGGDGNTIGGTTPSARNLIANSDDDGVALRGGATGNVIVGNFIGPDATGTASLENGNSGILIADAPGTVVGGADHDAGVCNRSCNLISGNDDHGIEILGDGGDGAVIQGNFIGTDITGTAPLRNEDAGIIVDRGTGATGAGGHQIGGATDPGVCSGPCNLLSGNDEEGIRIDDRVLENITVQGNFIGTDASGMAALPNGLDGMEVDGVGHQIGGGEPGLGNLISGNDDRGIDIGANDTVVQGNLIGTAIDGASPLGNGGDGIALTEAGKRIGGTAPGEGNVIAYNGGAGILHSFNISVPENARNPFLGNAIFANAGMGINLCVVIDFQCDTITDNDPGDGDEGVNRLQNFPEVASATGDGNVLTVTYTVPTATASAAYPLRVEFFLADADGEEGRAFIGAHTYEAGDAEQEASTSFSPATPVLDGDRILATATDAAGNTSEFGAAVVVVGNAVATEPGAEAPSGFALSAAYPNPFNPSTVLTLAVPAAGRVTVAVYDALGRRVAVLHEGLLAAGTHALRFDAAGLPSGVYAVRASGPAGTVAQRVTLAR